MPLPYVVTVKARTDVDKACEWFEAFAEGRGDDFLVEVQTHFRSIGDAPEAYGRARGTTRAAPLPHSKYIVYYEVEADRVVITAVQHARADPRRWRRRRPR